MGISSFGRGGKREGTFLMKSKNLTFHYPLIKNSENDTRQWQNLSFGAMVQAKIGSMWVGRAWTGGGISLTKRMSTFQ